MNDTINNFLAAIESRAEKATPGPWTAEMARWKKDAPVFGFAITAPGKIPFVASANVAGANHGLVQSEEERKYIKTGYSSEEVEANANLMADARNSIPTLVAMLRGAIGALKEISEHGTGSDDAEYSHAPIIARETLTTIETMAKGVA